jgi:hypothetical protein
MWSRIKQYLLIAAAGAAVYFLLSQHVIFYGEESNFLKNIYLLKKSKLNLHNTFVSLNQVPPEAVIKIKALRDDGIGDLLVAVGKISPEEKARLEHKYGN